MTTEDYCSYEVAKLLKEKGFDELCTKIYMKNGIIFRIPHGAHQNLTEEEEDECLCPTLQMAMKWLRTEKNIYIEIRRSFDTFLYGAIILKQDGIGIAEIGKTYYYYEDTVNAALSYALKNLI